jgi:hypothetical protein
VIFAKPHKMSRFAVVALLALTAAGCGASGSSSTSSTTSAAATSTPATTATSTTTASAQTQSTGAGTSAAPAGPVQCRADQLQLSFLGGQAATGHGLLGFELRNTGTGSCHTYGYPGVLFLNRSGAPLPTTPDHTTNDYFGSLPLAGVTLSSGATASFRLGVTHGINSTAGCGTAYALQVIPPNDTATLKVSIPNGAYECRTVTVSPVVPGSSAYP